MTAPALPFVCHGGAMHPLGRVRNVFGAHYGEGEIVMLAPVEERSKKSHDHFFALVAEAHGTLPDHMVDRYPTPDHLRKWALIKAGFRDERTLVASSRAEALRLAAFVKPMDEYAVVTVRDAVVTVYTAKSQSMKAMGKAVFGESKQKVLDVLADLLGVDAGALAGAKAA